MSQPIDYVPFETTTTAPAVPAMVSSDLERLGDVPVELTVEIGRTQLTIRDALALGPGSIVKLKRLAGEPVDLLVNGKPVARGEVVVVDDEFGLRVTDVLEDAPAPQRAEIEAAAAPVEFGIPAPAL